MLTDHRGKAEFPGPDGLVADHESPLHEELSHITKAERVAQVPKDWEQHDVGGELEVVERCAGAVVEAARHDLEE